MDPQAAITGLFTLGGLIVGSLVTLTIESRRTSGQLRVALFEKRYEGYEAVLTELSPVHDWMVQVCGNLGPKVLEGNELAEFAREAAIRTNRVTSAIQAHSLAIDRSGMEGVLAYLSLFKAAAEDGVPLPTIQELGERFGMAIDACHRSLSIPDLARATYREAERLRGRRR